MSNSVVQFSSKRVIASELNLANFVAQARSSAAFGSNFNFNSNIWDVTAQVAQKSKRSQTTIVFGAWGQPRPSKNVQIAWISGPFLQFAKAYVVYQYELTQKVTFVRDLQALRALDHALNACGHSSPTKLTSSVFNIAANVITEKHSAEAAHGIACVLQKISSLLDDKMIGDAPIQWRSPLEAPVSRGRLGEEFEKRRLRKLPSSEILTALGNAYHLASDPEDIVYSSMCALMLSSPDRANEVVSLLVDCESTTLGDGSLGYALRWWPSKGALPQLKAIPGVMQDLVRDAIGRIKKITEPARKIAKWYEDQISPARSMPTKIYLPKHLEYLRNKELVTRSEISLILWGDETIDPYTWCKSNQLPVAKLDGRKYLHRFADLEDAVIKNLPRHFPYADNTQRWKCSELLFTLPKFSNTARLPYLCIYVPMDRVDLNYRLDGRNKTSIFAKVGLADVVDGVVVPFKVSSHSFRHYLNHLAHESGELSDIDIDLWSGRTSRGEAYNHVGSSEIANRAALLVGDATSTLPVAKASPIQLYARHEFKRLGIESGHTTAFGYCVHDFSAAPCEKHEECLDCSEQFCIKGDLVKETNIRREREELESLIARAEAACESGVYGADRWLERQKIKLKRASDLISILDHPNVPYGVPIRLNGAGNYSRIEHVRSIAAEDSGHTELGAVKGNSKPAQEGGFSLLGLTKSQN
ncbi:hypothetical protein [Massilia sp. YIM B02443]|uniref:hypothetical protein n=1 Tax=Massilia sp. YIM B02443 TaxID=3050127 RepID=UPI0025B6631C|nr:hypothetical protein [Massilia sp. YIM B02443]MDN4035880.1 hypothetical protein [Massilia sp. YIM B02443]